MRQDSKLADCWYRFNFYCLFPSFTLGWSFRSEGSRHVPPEGPLLVLANHQSYLDPPLIGVAVRRRIWYLARKTLFDSPLLARFMESLGTLAVDQEGIAKEGLRASVERLQAGKALLIFPEGERTPSGEMLPFKPGITLVLKKAPVPILPVGVAGAFDAYPRQSKLPRFSPLFWPWTGAAFAASVGEPIPPARYQAMPREEQLTFLFDKVKEQVTRAEKLVRKPA
jgi:1-acyl-sn-glycerol-3-phosphate acyltransferase